MDADHRTKEQLLSELNELRGQIARLKEESGERIQDDEFLLLARFSISRAADGILWIRPDGKLHYVNDSMCKNLGYTREELLSMYIWEVDPNYPKEIWKEHWPEIKGRGSFTFESTHRAKNGQERPVEISVNYIKFGDNEYNCAFVREISERKRLEERLWLTQFTLDNFADPSVWSGPDGSILYVNKATCLSLGYTQEELLSMRVSDIDPNYPPDRYFQIWEELKRGGSIKIESTHRRKDGSILPLEASINYFKFGDREYLVSFNRDITKRKRAEKELRKSREILSKAQQIAHVGNWAWDLKTGLINCSGEIFKIFGYDAQEFQPSYEFLQSRVHTDDRDLVRKSIDAVINEDRLFNIDYRIVLPDGTIRYVNNVADKLKKGHDGNPEWLYGIIQDITKRKQVENELIEAKSQAELYLDLMGHDINNMNQIMMGFLELAHEKIEHEGKLDRDDINLIDIALDSLKNSSKLIDNVKKLQKIRLGDIHNNTVCPREVLEEACKQFSGMANVEINLDMPKACNVKIFADDLLIDVFSNIIGNAIKHSQQDKVKIDIRAKHVSEGGNKYCMIVFEDNGPGVPDERKRSIFNRFARGQTSTKGSGLGLHIVKTLIENYHGKIWVEDKVPGDHARGSRFIIMLPAIENVTNLQVNEVRH